MSGSKLVENLAESLVNELSESKTLDLMNDTKFQEFTDLLWEILDRVDKAEDRAKEQEKKVEDQEPLEEVKELAGKINDYFGKGGDDKDSMKDLSFKTDRILKIVQNLQKEDTGSSKKKEGDAKETNEKVAAEKKVQQKAEVDKQTNAMLRKLTKDFEESEKKRKNENSIVRKGLRRVEKKIGNLLTKALKKLKIPLLIAAIFLFRKKIKSFFTNLWDKHLEPIWNEYISPKVQTLVKWLGGVVGGLFENFKTWFKDTYPELYDWIKTEWPKVKQWFKDNWEAIKKWFVETFPKVKKAIDSMMDSWVVRQFRKSAAKDEREELIEKRKNAKSREEKASIDAEIAKVDYEINKADNAFKGETFGGAYENVPITINGIKRNVGLPGPMPDGTWISNPKELEEYLRGRITKAEDNLKVKREVSNEWEGKSLNYDTWQDRNISSFIPNSGTTLPEYDNPEGGGTGSGLGDVIPNSAGTVIDNSSRTHNETLNTMYIFKNVPPYESDIE